MEKGGFPVKRSVEVISGGEASGSLYPPPIDEINENVFSCQQVPARVVARDGYQIHLWTIPIRQQELHTRRRTWESATSISSDYMIASQSA